MVCPKCCSSNIMIKDSSVASFGMETVKWTLRVGYWGFKVVSHITDNFGSPRKLASLATRGVAGLIKFGAENIKTNVRKCKYQRCGYSCLMSIDIDFNF